ncbi:MAG: hydrogenase expression/formation protein HypE [Proteobacteria bacterium]|jgi:hydrogenase expression/formation protein HypE|nr:hydrogenase expression/formation protein HypE [Pseudomonadota bacterium]
MPDGPRILLGHGAGGRLSHQLVKEHFLPHLGNATLDAMLDSAVLGDLAFTTDAYVVSPRFFPGGDLGRLAICGTVNDLCMVGAKPQYLSAAFIVEEGLALDELDQLVRSMAKAAEEARVSVVAGDTKVVPHGACDGAFITTAGVGAIEAGFRPRPQKVVAGDVVIVSGTLADHGVAIMAVRENIRLRGDLVSDVAPLSALVGALREAKLEVHAMRDPTRGGVAQALLEIAAAARVRIILDEATIPMAPPTRAACELLGLDPLYVANEGKFLLFLPPEQAQRALGLLHSHPLGRQAAIIGQVQAGEVGCELQNELGGRRALRPASGELLPRIC